MSTSPKTCTCSTHAHAFSGDGNGVGNDVPLDETGSWQMNRLSRCLSFNLQKSVPLRTSHYCTCCSHQLLRKSPGSHSLQEQPKCHRLSRLAPGKGKLSGILFFFRDSCFSCFCFLRFVIHFVDKAWGGADWVSRISFRSSLKLELEELHSLDNCCTSVVSCETLLEMSKPKAENFSHRKHRIFRHSNVHVWFILDLSIHLSNHRFIYNISYSSTYLLLFVLYQVFIIYLLCIHSSLHFSADVDIYH